MPLGNILQNARRTLIAVIAVIFLAGPAPAAEPSVKVGVLANRGPEQCVKRWEPTIRYLTEKIPSCKFELVPLSFDEILPAVQNRKIDFIISNPAIFVDIEAMYGATAIATIKTRLQNSYYSVFGGVIFTRAGNASIRTLRDLKGKSFLGADRESLGGWQVQWRELKKAGLDPYRDFARLTFSGQHDTVVREVLKGSVDAGACRTDVLESMARQGEIRLADIRVIAEARDTQVAKSVFPFLISTRLYPEWPFAKLYHASPDIAAKVSLALQSMKASAPAAIAGEYGGWSYPLNYKPVQELQMELQIGYYKRLAPLGLRDIIHRYWKEITIAALLFAVITAALLLVSVLYRRMSLLKHKLDIELQQREKVEAELRRANSKLEHYAATDALTRIANRRKFDERLAEEWRRMARDQQPLSLILADIDHFKKYNDHYGHQAGDRCLSDVTREAGRHIWRPGDLLARYGGEEFVFILPATNKHNAVMIAQRIRIAVEALRIPHADSPVADCVTLSLGVATVVPQPTDDPGTLVGAADAALYHAKENGRNRVFAGA